jgi:hypothetical protein
VRVVLACALVLGCAVAWLSDPLVSAAKAAARPAGLSAPVTAITVDGNGGGRVYDGVGAILGGGGNARYLMDYPARERDQILAYLFKPDYGASLQILKLEIGGDSDSSDGSEPSIEHTRGHINCDAGYEFSIAARAVALNRNLRLYGLQWTAPGWVGKGAGRRFTTRDIHYLISWLGCAQRRGLTISYLGGWNEVDSSDHRAWFRRLRRALNRTGHRRVQIVAADSRGPRAWLYVGDRDIAVLGAHDVCGTETGVAGASTACTSPWSQDGHQESASQPMWASELGGMDGGALPGCQQPCAPAMDRAVIRGYVDARLTGFLEWPVLDAMPPGLPYENRGLVTADQPWSGSYQVNAMTWAIAQLTQFVQPPSRSGRVRWRFLDSGSGLLRHNAADGSYVSLVRRAAVRRRGGAAGSRGTAWSTIIEATTATSVQRAAFQVTGGSRLAGKTVHVWASDFSPATARRGRWFVRRPDIRPSRDGRFSLTIRPGWVYSLTTTTGQHRGSARGRAAAPFPLPFSESLASSGRAGRADDEPPYLAAMDGAFQLAPCRARIGRTRTCTEQEAAATPIFWHDRGALRGTHFPYAVIGGQNWANYKVSVDVLLTRPGTSAGLIGRFGCRMSVPNAGQFDGYVFDVDTTGAWRLIRNANSRSGHRSAACPAGPDTALTLASGRLARPLRAGTWHRLSLSMSGSQLTASVGAVTVASVSSSAWTSGLAGIEAGAFTGSWPQAQYSHLSVTPEPAAPPQPHAARR